MASSRRQYPFHLIEPRWQKTWDAQQTFRAWNPGDSIPADHGFAKRHKLSGKVTTAQLPPKFYILDMFPYPSGAGLHVGHPEGYTATDILARYRRALGFNVLHPMGWDSFGLPAEQYAVKTGQHPRKTTEENIANFTRQIKSLGFTYDWSRELATTDVDYFKWTQWIFLKLYNSWFNPETNKAEPIETLKPIVKKVVEDVKERHSQSSKPAFRYELILEATDLLEMGINTEAVVRNLVNTRRLAYVSEQPVWWCEQLGTVLANEEVVDGKSEVGGFPVVRKPMRQWMLRITSYAERLIQDLDTIDWSNSLKEMQRNWIGRSDGAEVQFRVEEVGNQKLHIAHCIEVFTTRPDTLFGATYLVLSPEHSFVDDLTTDEQRTAVEAYKKEVAKKSDLERTELAKEKTGVFTGAYAINPVNDGKIPIWIADYVLASYGTGAIMAVPAHDTRDFDFAKKFNLPVIQVVQPPDAKTDWQGFTDEGTSVNSGFISGLPTAEAKKKITAWLEEKKLGKKTINYKLRDWLFSRQRYWGEPFPIVWKKDAAGNLYHEALPASELPVLPPTLEDYKPTAGGEPPLARAKDWVNLPDGSIRETNTMPQWAGSCWYYLRYLDARRAESFCSPLAEHYWMGAPTSGLLLSDQQWRTRLSELLTKTPDTTKRYVTYAVIGSEEAEKLKAATGLDLLNYRRFIDDQAIAHILNEHGNPKVEELRGQLAVTLEDIALIPLIVIHPDCVRSAGKTSRHLDGILYEKRINGFLCCVEEVREGSGLLAVKTLYKMKATGAHAVAGLDQTSETFRRSNVNKPDDGAFVKPTPGVDLYVGGTEHAVLHLLYARFWHKVLFDLGYVSTPEPFYKLVNQGLILGELEYTVFQNQSGSYLSADAANIADAGDETLAWNSATKEGLKEIRVNEADVIARGGKFYLKAEPEIRVDARSYKMSKSRGNVINPDEIIQSFGADSLRLYEMFMGPLQDVKPWNTKGVEGVYRFLGRVWRLFVDENSETAYEQAETTEPHAGAELLDLILLDSAITNADATPAQLKALHACIKKVTEDLDGLRFNTAISAMMVFVNEAMTWQNKPLPVMKTFLQLLAPFAPHLAEELWVRLHSTFGQSAPSLSYEPWPKYDPTLLVESEIELPVQVNGKFRDVIKVAADADNATIEAAARAAEKVTAFITGKTIKKVIIVPKKMVNLIVG